MSGGKRAPKPLLQGTCICCGETLTVRADNYVFIYWQCACGEGILLTGHEIFSSRRYGPNNVRIDERHDTTANGHGAICYDCWEGSGGKRESGCWWLQRVEDAEAELRAKRAADRAHAHNEAPPPLAHAPAAGPGIVIPPYVAGTDMDMETELLIAALRLRFGGIERPEVVKRAVLMLAESEGIAGFVAVARGGKP